MARLSYTVTGQTTANATIIEMATTSTYQSVYITLRRGTNNSGTYIGISPNLARSLGNSSSSTWYMTGLSPGTTYYLYWEITTISGNSANGSTTFTTQSPPAPPPIPNAPSYVSATASSSTRGLITISWGSSSGATSYGVMIYLNGSSRVHNQTVTSTSLSVTLSEYSSYRVDVLASNSSGNSSTSSTWVNTPDLTPPSISSISGNGNGVMSFSWYASDSGIGLRSYNTYFVQISNADGTTYGSGQYTTNSFMSFLSDGNGLSFKNNSYYYMRVMAYDGSGNSSSSSVRVQFKDVRPSDWSWYTSKVSGSTVNITAQEWNSFCTKINQFRQYKNFSEYSFTTVYTGGTITAAQANQARSAIASMTPPTSLPSNAVTGQPINASFFNGLRNSLNSI